MKGFGPIPTFWLQSHLQGDISINTSNYRAILDSLGIGWNSIVGLKFAITVQGIVGEGYRQIRDQFQPLKTIQLHSDTSHSFHIIYTRAKSRTTTGKCVQDL